MALSVARPKYGSFTNPILVHLFSTSSSSSSPENPPPDQQNPRNDNTDSSQSSISEASFFADVKAKLKAQAQIQQSQSQFNKPTFRPLRKHSNANPSETQMSPSSLQDIRKSLSRYSAVPFDAAQPQSPLSFQELYNRNRPSSASTETAKMSKDQTFNHIKASLRNLESNLEGKVKAAGSLTGFRYRNPNTTHGAGPTTSSVNVSPFPVSGKKDGEERDTEMSTDFLRIYGYEELGKELNELRPQVEEGENGSFSLSELNERLVKLRKKEEMQSTMGFRELRDSLVTLNQNVEEKKKSEQVASKYIKMSIPL